MSIDAIDVNRSSYVIGARQPGRRGPSARPIVAILAALAIALAAFLVASNFVVRSSPASISGAPAHDTWYLDGAAAPVVAPATSGGAPAHDTWYLDGAAAPVVAPATSGGAPAHDTWYLDGAAAPVVAPATSGGAPAHDTWYLDGAAAPVVAPASNDLRNSGEKGQPGAHPWQAAPVRR